MLRKLLLHALPFLLPFVLYAAWLALGRQRGRAAGGSEQLGWREAPWMWLLLAGLSLTAISLAVLPLFQGDEPGKTYAPARYVDGEIVPGETR